MKAEIQTDSNQTLPVVTMGPISILPSYQGQGYRKQLLDFALEKAAALGFGTLCFEGDIHFYDKSGFRYVSAYGIRYHGLLEEAEAEAFDQTFPYKDKEKLELPGQLF